MATRVTIEWNGLEEVISNLTSIEERAPKNIERQITSLADATEQAWKDETPRRTGQLQEADTAHVDGMSFTLNNATKYYDWVNDGHMTTKGWRTKHGYRVAKRRSHVKGQQITEKALEFVKDNIEDYLSKFLED